MLQSKRPRKLSSHWFLLALAALVVFSGLAWLAIFPPLTRVERQLRATVNEHLRSARECTWLLDKAVPSGSRQTDVCQDRRRALAHAASAWCPHSPLGDAVRQLSGQMGWAVAYNAKPGNRFDGVWVVSGNAETGSIVLFPRDVSEFRGTHPVLGVPDAANFCLQSTERHLVIVTAYGMPDQLFAALTLHEVGHAHNYWRLGKAAGSDQEVEMHELSAAILDNYSGGSYHRSIARIVDRIWFTSRGDVRRVFASLTPADMDELDTICGCTEIGRRPQESLVVQHLLTIGFAALDRRGAGLIEKATLYDWIMTLARN